MKVLFLTDNFTPEFNAPATRTYEHCKQWQRNGVDVTVITCVPNFPKGEVFKGYKNKWKQVEFIDGIRVIRVWSFITSNEGTFKRTFDFISFAITSFLAGLFVKTDLIVATSPQFFTAISGFGLSVFKRKPWVMEVRDLWPESIKAVSAVNANWVLLLMEKVELFLYKHAKKVVVVTDSFKTNLTNRGIEPEKITIIKNGVDLSKFKPLGKDREILEKYGLREKFVIGYVGTHGLAHSLDFIVSSIKQIQDDSIRFLFIGDGAEKSNVVKLANELGVTNAVFLDPVEKSQIHRYLSVLDVALVPLKNSPTFRSVIPSKIFESAAMNIPILLGVSGESQKMIESYQAGICFYPEDTADFIEKVSQIKNQLSKGKVFQQGSKTLANDFNRELLANKMLEDLKSIKK